MTAIADPMEWLQNGFMPLGYTQPSEGLARELREVARDAIALSEVLTEGLNFNLPPDFPKEQLIEITRSLMQLPGGTAEGCRPSLQYARDRLPAIRRAYVLSEELDVPTRDIDAAPRQPCLCHVDQQNVSQSFFPIYKVDEAMRYLNDHPGKQDDWGNDAKNNIVLLLR
jgi:hypothetical protein